MRARGNLVLSSFLSLSCEYKPLNTTVVKSSSPVTSLQPAVWPTPRLKFQRKSSTFSDMTGDATHVINRVLLDSIPRQSQYPNHPHHTQTLTNLNMISSALSRSIRPAIRHNLFRTPTNTRAINFEASHLNVSSLADPSCCEIIENSSDPR